ncbi:hypothetical protein F4813DRAFT_392657 [Daldinia decipiens]|uniref:uncharacterized protein n=1 Tax=Daldinia decipiens TaxID=326647 RepID=UPI0020C4A7D2|nr:uncharacterized protein F4813DRAFT_392657 [Daldinia decipiens]KAI1654409.1 hypothetical protein F4813DRAFT_392657 [Daldinia decipiens]
MGMTAAFSTNMSFHGNTGKKSKSSKGNSWNGLYLERKKSDRGTINVRRPDAAPEPSKPRGRSPGRSGCHETHHGSHRSSYSSSLGSPGGSPQRDQYKTNYIGQHGDQRGNQYGSQYGNQYGSQYGNYGGPNIPPPQQTMPTQPTVPEEPVPFASQPGGQQPTQAGYQVVEMPMPGGRPLRVSVATGYTANGVAYQANGYLPPNGNPNGNQYQAASNAQAPGCTKDNPVNQYYRGSWF